MADRVLEHAMAKKGLGVPAAESKNILNQLAEQDAEIADKLKKINRQKKDEKAAAWESGSVKQQGRSSVGNTLNGIGEYFLYGVGKGVQNITLDNVNAQKLQALQRTTMIYEDIAQKESEKYGSVSERTASALLKARAEEQQELNEQQKFYSAPDDYSVLAEKYPASGAKQGVYDASSALGSLGVSMLAGAAGKGMGANAPSLGKMPAMTPAIVAQARGGAYGQAIAEGAQAEEARAYANMSGAKEGATEAMFGFAGPLSKIAGKGILNKPAGQALGKVLGKAAEELPNNSLKNVALNTAKGAAGEGAEEALSGAIDPYLQRATYNPEAENATAEELAYQAAIGAALGSILGGGSNVLEYRGQNKTAVRKQESAQRAQMPRVNIYTSAEMNGLKRQIGVDQEGQKVIVRREPKESDMPQIKAEYEKSVDSRLLQFVRDVKNKIAVASYYKLSNVQSIEAEDIKELTGIDTTGFTHNIRTNTINHIEKRHGMNGNADHTMADENDIARIGYVIDNYDTVKVSNEKNNWIKNADNTPAKTIVYKKRVNGDYYVVEAVPDSKAKALQIISAYKTKKQTPAVTDAAEAPQFNVQNERQAKSAFNPTITQENPAVNRSPYEEAYANMLRGEDATKPKVETEDEKNVKRFIQSAAVRARLEVRYDDMPLKRKAYYADGVLHINKNKLNEGMKVTAAHEIYHALEGTKEHDAVVELAIKAQGGDTQSLIAQKIAEYANAGITLDEAGARAEIGAAFIEKAMSDEATINQVLLENRTLAQRILQWIKDMLSVFEKRKTMSAADLTEYKALLKARKQYEQGLTKLREGKYEPAGVERNARYSVSQEETDKQAQTQKKIEARYRQDVEKVKQDKYNSRDTLLLGYTPKVFTDIGFNKLPFVIGNKHVYSIAVDEQTAKNEGRYNKHSNYHNMGWSFVSDIYNRISDPVAIISSEANPQDGIVAIVDNNGKLAAIAIDGYGRISGEAIDANALATSYEDVNKANRLLKNALAKEQQGQVAVFYINNTKLAQFSPAGISLPRTAANPTNLVIHSLTDQGSPVKIKFKDVTESQQFKKWFGDWTKGSKGASKVVDKNGKPLVVYHGSKIEPDIFKTKNKWGYGGSYFSTNPKVAAMYGDKITSAYINLRNPFIVEADAKRYDMIARPKEMGKGGLVDTQEIAAWARTHGYDGVIVRDVVENGGIGDDIIAFESNQVKSTDNVGTFNGKKDNARYSLDTDSRYNDLTDQYGAMDKGMEPRVDVDVPKQTNDFDKTRRFTRTAMESENVSDEAKEAIADDLAGDISSGRFTYEPTSNEKLQEKANASIARNGYEGAKQGIFKKYRDNEAFKAEDVALLEQLIVKASAEGRTQDAVDMIGLAAMVGTEMGQSVQALSMLKRMTPEGRLKQMELLRDRLNTKYGLTDEKQININERYKRMLLNKDNSQSDIETIQSYIIDDLAKQLPVSLKDKFDAWRYLAMLGNPRTHMRNFIGNTMNLTISRLNDQLAGIVESKFVREGERTRAAGRASKELKDYALKDWEAEGQYRTDLSNKYGERGRAERNKQIFKTKGLESLRKFNENALDAEDTLFKKKQYIYALSHYMKANNITPAEMEQGGIRAEAARSFAEDEAFKVTFQEYNALANALNRFENKDTDSKLEKTGQMAVKALMPFKKTPLNILKRGVEYSPVGLANGLSDMYKLLRKGEMNATEVISEITQGLTGSAVVALGYFLAEMGLLTAGYDEENKRRQNYENQLGGQNYALTLPGGGSYTLDWAAPVVMPMFVGAAVHDEIMSRADDENKGLLQSVLHGLIKVTDPVLEMSCMDSLQSALESYGNEGATSNMITSAVKSYLMQFVPTLSGQVARTVDETKRSTYAPSDSPYTKTGESLGRQFMNKVPGLSYASEPALDVWGREREQAGGNMAGRAVLNMLSPGTYAPDKETMADKEIKRLYDTLGEDKVIPKTAAKYITQKVDGKSRTYYLTAKEYTKYQTKYGQDNFKAVSELMRSNVYRKMSDADKADAIAEIYSYNGKAAKQEFFKGRKVEYDEGAEMTAKLKSDGGWVGYFAIKQAFPDDSYEVAKKHKEKCDRYGIDYTAYAESRAKISELKSANSGRYAKAGEKTAANKRDIARYLAGRKDLTNPQRQVIWQEEYTSETYMSVAKQQAVYREGSQL